MPQPLLWYFADPMCSWCWGFTPVMEQIKQQYDDRLKIALVMGGLRPGTTDPITPSLREELLHHWQEVQRRSGAEFRTEGALPEGFVYDTEPAARAVITVGGLKPETTFAFYQSLQSAFYTRGVDVTRTDELASLAEEQNIEPLPFLEAFDSDPVRQKTRMHFVQTRSYGVQGFPTLIAEGGGERRVLTRGYQDFPSLQAQLDAWLAGADASP